MQGEVFMLTLPKFFKLRQFQLTTDVNELAILIFQFETIISYHLQLYKIYIYIYVLFLREREFTFKKYGKTIIF